MSNDIFVYTAVPNGSKHLLEKFGLMSAVEVSKNPEVLNVARPDKESRNRFINSVRDRVNSDYPHSVLGPSVLFSIPDPDKITEDHFINQWNLDTVRINLSKLIEDYPDTIIWGAELIPFNKEWRELTDDEFDDLIIDLGFESLQDFIDSRHHLLSISEVSRLSKKSPKELWESYDISDSGHKYASNVPHAFIITSMGNIPFEYIEYIDKRKNPEDFDYRDSHEAPDSEYGSPMWNVSQMSYPKDFYSYNGLRYYGFGDSLQDREAYNEIVASHGKRDRSITMYRSIPKSIPKSEQKINIGDWVTPVRNYAVEHGRRRFGVGNWKIIRKRVYARDLWTDGNDLCEWGYDPQDVTPVEDRDQWEIEMHGKDYLEKIARRSKFNTKHRETSR